MMTYPHAKSLVCAFRFIMEMKDQTVNDDSYRIIPNTLDVTSTAESHRSIVKRFDPHLRLYAHFYYLAQYQEIAETYKMCTGEKNLYGSTYQRFMLYLRDEVLPHISKASTEQDDKAVTDYAPASSTATKKRISCSYIYVPNHALTQEDRNHLKRLEDIDTGKDSTGADRIIRKDKTLPTYKALTQESFKEREDWSSTELGLVVANLSALQLSFHYEWLTKEEQELMDTYGTETAMMLKCITSLKNRRVILGEQVRTFIVNKLLGDGQQAPASVTPRKASAKGKRIPSSKSTTGKEVRDSTLPPSSSSSSSSVTETQGKPTTDITPSSKSNDTPSGKRETETADDKPRTGDVDKGALPDKDTQEQEVESGDESSGSEVLIVDPPTKKQGPQPDNMVKVEPSDSSNKRKLDKAFPDKLPANLGPLPPPELPLVPYVPPVIPPAIASPGGTPAAQLVVLTPNTISMSQMIYGSLNSLDAKESYLKQVLKNPSSTPSDKEWANKHLSAFEEL